jgi:hypothetical protein
MKPCSATAINHKHVRFSICTLVTDHEEYSAMVGSFRAHGFDGKDCEYLFLDNSQGNKFDAFAGGNIFLREAAGEFIIFCHQDVLLVDDDREVLERRMADLSGLEPNWALCGNAGGTVSGTNSIRISDPHGANQAWGSFPALANALDENFIVIRRDANLALSHDLVGFHLYGADLCIVAEILGRSAWVINFHLLHKSGGRADASFYAARRALENKYRRALRSRRVNTTVTNLYLRPGKLGDMLNWLRRRLSSDRFAP